MERIEIAKIQFGRKSDSNPNAALHRYFDSTGAFVEDTESSQTSETSTHKFRNNNMKSVATLFTASLLATSAAAFSGSSSFSGSQLAPAPASNAVLTMEYIPS